MTRVYIDLSWVKRLPYMHSGQPWSYSPSMMSNEPRR